MTKQNITENRNEYQKKYQQSAKGKVAYKKATKKYQQSEKGKMVHQRSYKKFMATERGKICRRNCAKRYYEHNKDKHKAKGRIRYAIIKGVILPARYYKCSECKKQAQYYHHHLGYAPEHWFDVVPVCFKCHFKLHKF